MLDFTVFVVKCMPPVPTPPVLSVPMLRRTPSSNPLRRAAARRLIYERNGEGLIAPEHSLRLPVR
jgi:hypothetical protein